MKPTKQQVRAGCYLRISSDPADKRAGVDRQRADTLTLCEVKGWTPAGFYRDNNRSASNGKGRPEWERLLADIENGKIDAICAWDQDRNWRMMDELQDLRRFFAGLGREIKLATTGQGEIDLYSPTGVLTAQIKTAVSEHEIAMMRVRQRRAARQRAESGKPKWRKAFGYQPYTGPKEADDGTRRIDPKTSKLVKRAYRALLAGHSLNDIAAIFNDAGAVGLTGRPWTASTVSLFLRSPRNAGLRGYDGGICGKGTWKPLVDESTWRAAQAKLSEPGRKPGPKSVRKHLLTGVLQCGAPGCGGHLGGNWQVQKTGGASGRPKAGETKTHPGTLAYQLTYSCKKCHRVSIRAEHVEPIIKDWVAVRLAEPDARELLLRTEMDETQAEATRLELETLYGEVAAIGVERGQGLLTGLQAKAATDILNNKIAKLEARQHDREMLQVFDGIPLGTPGVPEALDTLTPDRWRAVIRVLMNPTVAPVGKSGHVFNSARVQPNWRHGRD